MEVVYARHPGTHIYIYIYIYIRSTGHECGGFREAREIRLTALQGVCGVNAHLSRLKRGLSLVQGKDVTQPIRREVCSCRSTYAQCIVAFSSLIQLKLGP